MAWGAWLSMIDLRRRLNVRVMGRLAALTIVASTAAWFLFPFPMRNLEIYPASMQLVDRDGNPLRVVLGPDDTRCDPVDFRGLSDRAVQALVAAEDKRFWRHSGVDVIALTRAVFQNIWFGEVVSGASTLSTQVIRLSTPRRRTLITKLIETFRAIQMECRLSKREILTQYLNRAPFGGNLVGLQAASLRYFGKDASELTLAEASLLAGLPQAPSRFQPNRHLPRALKRREYVLGRMMSLGAIDPAEKAEAERQPLRVGKHPNPFIAPHFCDLVLQELPEDMSNSTSSGSGGARASQRAVFEIRTTLADPLQHIASGALTDHVNRFRQQGIHGGAVVILEVKTGFVRALVGSPDYDDQQHAGQVNGATRPRSPGSALKPFAYAMAFDNGLLTPDSMVADVPTHFTDYDPENFGRQFNGLVTVRKALVQSLNIPALKTVREIGLESFIARLRELGLRSIDQPALHYGLSVVLGTAEVRLLDLVNAYACLARGGVYLPYRLLEKDGMSGGADGFEGQRLFSTAAAYLVADALGGDERPMAVAGHTADVRHPRVAWKTGTSNGHRDAWTVGYNPDYVVGIWLGNPDGTPAHGLIGTEVAAPVVLDIFRRLYPQNDSPWFVQPDEVATIRTCAASGRSPGPKCTNITEGLGIPGVSDPRPCTAHNIVFRGGSDDSTTPESHVQRARRMTGPDSFRRPPLRIESPRDGSVYQVVGVSAQKLDRLTLTATTSESTILYWFVDGRHIGSAPAHQAMAWSLRHGTHVIACSDASGHADRVSIRVE